MNGATETQEAVYQALTTIEGARVYDFVPETAEMPYIRIGDDSLESAGCKDEGIDYADITVDIFSEYDGYSELKTLAQAVMNKLNNIDARIRNTSVRILSVSSANYERDEDYRQATISARFVVAR